MKKIFIGAIALMALALTLNTRPAQAQTQQIIPTVSVNGSAEVKVTPDVIYLSIRLDESDTKGRLPIEEQRQKMFTALKRADVDAEKQLSVQGMSSEFFRRRQSLLATQYELRLESAAAVRKVFDELDKAGITNVNVTRTTYSDMESLRSEARTKAMQNAQQRARELAEAVGQKIGACYEINDYTTTTETVYGKRLMMSNAAMMDSAAVEAEPNVEFEQIKVAYNVSAKFYLITEKP